MIKLSRLTDYAVVILAAMAGRDGALMSASSLSAATSLPEPTVSKVLKLLSKGGVINSERGVNGGYALRNKPDRIMVSDIIAAMEGPIALTACVEGSHEGCVIENICRQRGRWDIVNRAVVTALENVTLADMLPQQNRHAREGGHPAGLPDPRQRGGDAGV